MLRKILIALACIVAVFVVIVAVQPPDFRIARSAVVAAPAATVFPHVNDFHQWKAWSPWAKLDPAMKEQYGGAPAGKGAIYAWQGNNEVGEGRMTILESTPNELVTIQLEFLKPFAATNTAEFTFKPDGEQTRVTWSMSGKKNFAAKAFHLFVDMDKMVGGDFEKGLNALKGIAEGKQ